MKAPLHFIIIILFFFCITNVAAQEASADVHENEEELPKFAFEKAVVVGASYTHIKFKTVHSESHDRKDRQYQGYSLEDFSDSQDITGGLLLTFSSPKLSQKLKLATGFLINSYTTEVLIGNYDYVKTPYGSGGRYRISALYVTVPLLFQIDLSKKPLVPYVKLGPSVGILARVSHNKQGWWHDFEGNRQEMLNVDPENKRTSIGAASALGLRFPVYGKHNGIFEVGYQMNDGLAPRNRAHQFNQIFSAMLGFTF